MTGYGRGRRAKTIRWVILGSHLFKTCFGGIRAVKKVAWFLCHAPKRLPSKAPAPSFPQSLNHLLRQLRPDAALFVLEVNKRFLPLTLLCLGEFCPAVDVGRLIIFAS